MKEDKPDLNPFDAPVRYTLEMACACRGIHERLLTRGRVSDEVKRLVKLADEAITDIDEQLDSEEEDQH